MQEINLELRQSKTLTAIVAVIFCLAIVAVMLLQAHWIVKLFLVSVLIASSAYTLRQTLLLDADAIVGLQSKQLERIWLTKLNSGNSTKITAYECQRFFDQ